MSSVAEKLLGTYAYQKFLQACGENHVKERHLKDIAEQISGRVSGNLQRNIEKNGYNGRSTAKDMLNDWYQLHGQSHMSVGRLQDILKSDDVYLNALASELVDHGDHVDNGSTGPKGPTQSAGSTRPAGPRGPARPTQLEPVEGATNITHYNIGPITGNIQINQGNNNQSTSSYEANLTCLEDSLEKFVKNFPETEKLGLEETLTTLKGQGKGTAIPKVSTLLESICLIKTPGGCIGTAFLAKVNGVSGVVLFTAGHNLYEQLEKGCTDVGMNGSCKEKSGCNVHGFYTIDYSKFTLFFKNLEGITTPNNNPPKPPQFTIQQLIDQFPKYKMLMACRNITREDIKREDMPIKKTTYDKNPRKKYEDYFAMVMYDDENGTTAQSKLEGLGLTVLAEVGSSLEKKAGTILSMVGYPFVPEDYNKVDPKTSQPKQCIPLRFLFGAEINGPAAGYNDRILYDFDTLPGNSGSPLLGWQSMEPNYYIKAIHVAGNNKWNLAQRLTNILEELKK